MSVDPALKQLAVEIEGSTRFPSLRCPSCGTSTVSFALPTQFETAETREARSHDAHDYDWENGTFLAQGTCGALHCQQVVIATGTWRLDYGKGAQYAQSYFDRFSPFYRVEQMHPPLRLMELPEDAAETDKGKFRQLEDRLKEWRNQDPTREGIADLMLAVKWLGNVGTHEDNTPAVADVVDGANLLNEAFHRPYVSPAITAAAAAINASRGPKASPN